MLNFLKSIRLCTITYGIDFNALIIKTTERTRSTLLIRGSLKKMAICGEKTTNKGVKIAADKK